MAQATLHSPSTGFRDIKSPPDFHPSPAWVPYALLGIAAALLIWYLISRRQTAAPAEPPIPPLERAIRRLAELDRLRAAQQIALRDLSSEISLAFRRFIEERFSFPAAEQTASEFTHAFPNHLRRALPLLPADRRTTIERETRDRLRFLERVSFAGDSGAAFHLDSPELPETCRALQTLITDLDAFLVAELSRFENPRRGTSGGAP